MLNYFYLSKAVQSDWTTPNLPLHPYFEVQEKCTTFEAEPVRENFARVHPNINAKIQKNTQNTAANKEKNSILK